MKICKTRHMPVHAQQPGAARCEGERAKYRLGAFKDLAVGQHQLNRPREGLFGDLRKTRRGLARLHIVDSVCRQRFPPNDPTAAEPAIAVEDEERAVRRSRHRARHNIASLCKGIKGRRGGQRTDHLLQRTEID